MGRSVKSKINKGTIRVIWNQTLLKMQYYKKTTRGLFIECNPFSGSYLMKGPGYHPKTLDKWEKQV